MEAIGTAFAAETNRRDEDTEMFVTIHVADNYWIIMEYWCQKKRITHKIVFTSYNMQTHCTYMYNV